MKNRLPGADILGVAGRLDCAWLLVLDEAAGFTADDIKDTEACKRGKAGKKLLSVQICLRLKARKQILDTTISGSKYHIRRGVLF